MAKQLGPACQKFDEIMKSVTVGEPEFLKNHNRLAELGSGDLFDACDYISKDYVPPKSGTYFNKQDMIELMREVEEELGYKFDDWRCE
jgi:hypothetical protein